MSRLIFALLGFMVCARLIPHVANFVPVFAIFTIMMAKLNRLRAVLLFFPVLLLSDLLLMMIKGYTFSGNWLLINYLSYLALCLSPNIGSQRGALFLYGGVLFPFAFWIISNCLIWLLTPFYLSTLTGLVNCYFLALPFLWTSIAANAIFIVVILNISNVLQDARFNDEKYLSHKTC